MSDEEITVGKFLRIARMKKGLTQKHVAQKLGVEPSYICKMEKNEAVVPPGRFKDFVEVCSMDKENEKQFQP